MSTRTPVGSPLQDGLSFAVSEDDMNRLWRAQHAATLLAALSTEAVSFVNVSRDSTAAVAEYIAQDVLDVLNRAQSIGAMPKPSRGPDAI